jgi:hypothetical protein
MIKVAPPVTKPIVTLRNNVTLAARPLRNVGRPPKYASAAERQKAYRERMKARKS